MPPLTRRRCRETTRKLATGLVLVLVSGCATSGPNHAYLTTAASLALQDLGPPPAAIPGVLQPGEQALGLAYDFKHRPPLRARRPRRKSSASSSAPSGKILREMPLPAELHATGSADLAIRSRDRHLFAAHPDGRSVVELTLFGEFVRRIELAGFEGTFGGLAFDQKHDRLLVLGVAPGRVQVGVVAATGSVTYYAALAAAVNPVSLGYDSETGHCFVPLADGVSLGEFDAAGRLVATHPAAGPITAIDAGPRSFLRVF
jgi:hypothetical protein